MLTTVTTRKPGRVVGFNENVVSADVGRSIRAHATAIRGLLADSASNVIQIGLRLQQVHEIIGDRYWPAWLLAELNWSPRVARDVVQIAQRFGEVKSIGQLQPAALALLVGKSVDPRAIDDALALADAGTFVTKSTARELVQKYKPAAEASEPKIDPVTHLRAIALRLADTLGADFLIAELTALAAELQQPGCEQPAPAVASAGKSPDHAAS